MDPNDVLKAIAAGNHDIDSIAAALGVNHTNGTLRKTLMMLAQVGAVIRSTTGHRDADGHMIYRLDLNL